MEMGYLQGYFKETAPVQPKYTLTDLKKQKEQGVDFFGFWGARGETKEEKSFSNFYKSPFTLTLPDGTSLNFTCNEQYFMFRKAVEFGDVAVLEELKKQNLTPKEYKQLGRQVKNYNEKVWNAVRYGVMLEGLRLKYTQNKGLKETLIKTTNKILVETSPYDKIWGVGLSKRDNWTDIDNWRGQNLLGIALMHLRDELQVCH